MLTAADIGPDFVDGTFTPDNGSTACGAPSPKATVGPTTDIGSAASNGVASFEEEGLVFRSPDDAQLVLDQTKEDTQCTSPTVRGGEPVAFSSPIDVTSSITTPVEAAFEIDFQTTEAQGQLFIIKDGVAIVTFVFVTQQGADTSRLPTAISLVNKGIDRIVNG
jgi:hypothetical protein